MKRFNVTLRAGGAVGFNLTPLIDVVFLLIVFFMLVCQFIVQENYELEPPDDCENAIVQDHLDSGAITVSVYPQSEGAGAGVLYAVRAKRFDPGAARYRDNGDLLIADLAAEITEQARRKADPLIHLRADKDLTYGDVQQALLALAQGQITKVQLAAFRSEQKTETNEVP